jgi:hypothetical protein
MPGNDALHGAHRSKSPLAAPHNAHICGSRHRVLRNADAPTCCVQTRTRWMWSNPAVKFAAR